jgi:hypothetical protein
MAKYRTKKTIFRVFFGSFVQSRPANTSHGSMPPPVLPREFRPHGNSQVVGQLLLYFKNYTTFVLFFFSFRLFTTMVRCQAKRSLPSKDAAGIRVTPTRAAKKSSTPAPVAIAVPIPQQQNIGSGSSTTSAPSTTTMPPMPMLLPTLPSLASMPSLQPMNLFQGLFPTLAPFPVVNTAAQTPATNSERVVRSMPQSVPHDATPVLQNGNITIGINGDINVQVPERGNDDDDEEEEEEVVAAVQDNVTDIQSPPRHDPPQDAGTLYYLFYKPLDIDHPTWHKMQEKAGTEAEPCVFSVTLTDIVWEAFPNQPPNNNNTGELKQGIVTIKRKNPKETTMELLSPLPTLLFPEITRITRCRSW